MKILKAVEFFFILLNFQSCIIILSQRWKFTWKSPQQDVKFNKIMIENLSKLKKIIFFIILFEETNTYTPRWKMTDWLIEWPKGHTPSGGDTRLGYFAIDSMKQYMGKEKFSKLLISHRFTFKSTDFYVSYVRVPTDWFDY